MSKKLLPGEITNSSNIATEDIDFTASPPPDEEIAQSVEGLTKESEKKRKKFDWALVKVLIIIVLIACMIKAVGSPMVVVGTSMTPTYQDGQVLFGIRKYISNVGLGEVVCFKNENTNWEIYIKRVEGLPGDRILIEDGVLYRNGEAVAEGFDKMQTGGVFETEVTLGDNEYFVLGDNRNGSKDSRYIGPISGDDITFVVPFSNNY